MSGNKTLTMIKPTAVERGYIGAILAKINEAGFRIAAMKFIHLRKEEAQAFYAVHAERPFFNDLVTFMSSGPIVVAILEKDSAVDAFRKIIGATNPKDAEEGSIRKLYGDSLQSNAVHGSDSNENAEIECNFFFSTMERF